MMTIVQGVKSTHAIVAAHDVLESERCADCRGELNRADELIVCRCYDQGMTPLCARCAEVEAPPLAHVLWICGVGRDLFGENELSRSDLGEVIGHLKASLEGFHH